jgi:hypothetical protein
MLRGMVWSNRVRDNQSATQVNTIRRRQVGETARDARSQVRLRAEPAALTEHGKGWLLGLVLWLVVEWLVKVISDKHGRPALG